MTDEDLRTEIRDLVTPASMTAETIIEELSKEYPERDVKVTLADMVADGVLEEHPDFEDTYRLPE